MQSDINNQHIVEPTLFYLERLASRSRSEGGEDSGKDIWRDAEGNVLLKR